MKKKYLYLMILVGILVACESNESGKLSFEGDLYAKNLIGLHADLPDQAAEIEYSWYISPTLDGEWEKLQGIWTDEIILLTSYMGKFLKCEVSYRIPGKDERKMLSVVSKGAIEYRGNPNTDWFRDAGYGIMVHYLKPVIVPEGDAGEWNEAVNSFDVELFADQAEEARAGFVMFTLGQNSGYYCSPNATFDSIVGVEPGALCSTRDLPQDLIKALNKYNIPVILYLPSNPPVGNKLVSEKFKYPFKKRLQISVIFSP